MEDPYEDDLRSGRHSYYGETPYVSPTRRRSPLPESSSPSRYYADGHLPYKPSLDISDIWTPKNVVHIDLQVGSNAATFDVKPPERQLTQERLVSDQETAKRLHCRSIERRDVLSARRYVDQEGKESVVLQAREEGTQIQDRQFRWIHMECESRTLKEFESFVCGLSGLETDEKSLVVKLMSQVSQNFVKTHASGSHLSAGAHRCDGHFPPHLNQPDMWAIFLSLPFLSLDDLSSTTIVPRKDTFQNYTLFQTAYPDQDSTLERDRMQYFAKADYGRSKVLHVHQLWAISLSSGTLITSSSEPAKTVLADSIELDDRKSGAQTQVEMIKFTDPAGRIFFFPVGQCKTWFALMDKVVGVCVKNFKRNGSDPEDYRLFDAKGNQVSASEWQSFLAEQTLSCVSLRAALTTTTPPPPPAPEMPGALVVRREEERDGYRSRSGLHIRRKPRPSSVHRSTSEDNEEEEEEEEDSDSAMDSDDDVGPAGRSGDDMRQRAGEASYPPIGFGGVHRVKTLLEQHDRKALVLYRDPREEKSNHLSRRGTDHSNATSRRDEREVVLRRRTDSRDRDVRSPQRRSSIESGPGESVGRQLIIRRRSQKKVSRHGISAMTPNSRIPRYILSPIEEVVDNRVVKPQKFEHIYFIPSALLEEPAKQVTAIEAADTPKEQESAPVSEDATDSADHNVPNFASEDVPKETGDQLNIVPPVFFWRTSNERDDVDASQRLMETIGDMENVKVVLTQVDNELSKAKRVNTALTKETKYTEGKLYRSAQTATKDDVYKYLEQREGEVRPLLAGKIYPKGLSEFGTMVRTAVKILDELSNFFLAADYPCQLLSKYWGSVGLLIDCLYMLRKADIKIKNHNRKGSSVKNDDNDPSTHAFVIVNAEWTFRTGEDGKLVYPQRSVLDCETCSGPAGLKKYSSREDAENHMKDIHFTLGDVSRKTLSDWIKPSTEAWSFQLQSDAISLLTLSLDHLNHLQKAKREICDGICTDNKFDAATYRLPAGLVKAFQRLLVLNLYLAHTAKMAYNSHKTTAGEALFTFINNDHRRHIQDLAYGAEGGLDEAKINMMLMSRAKDYNNSIQYDAISQNYLLGLICGNMQARVRSDEGFDLTGQYRKCYEDLRYQTSHRPRRRLLRELHLFCEEVDAAEGIWWAAHLSLGEFHDLLTPIGFRATTKARQSAYYDFEDKLMDRLAASSRDGTAAYCTLIRDVKSLSTTLLQVIEILNDDQGKAILAFTVVTIVFLPMSFVTGLLGMNTADFRGMRSGQWLYWAIAVPLTLLVVVGAVGVGYGVEGLKRLRDGFLDGSESKKGRKGLGGRVDQETLKIDEVEEFEERKREFDISAGAGAGSGVPTSRKNRDGGVPVSDDDVYPSAPARRTTLVPPVVVNGEVEAGGVGKNGGTRTRSVKSFMRERKVTIKDGDVV